jgi:adenosylhomocysteine nucleosidase
VDLIINSGTAGGMDEKLELFDTVVSTQAAYHDVDEKILTEFHPGLSSIYFDADESLLHAAQKTVQRIKTGHTVYFGRMVTGEQFIEDDLRDEINDKFAPLSVDMETASIAHVCYVNRIPFIAIRTITDTATHSGIGTFEENCMQASGISKEIVVELLKEL